MQEHNQTQGSAAEVLGVFARLGCTSFGGPIAHLAYFRQELVLRRQWLSEEQYANLLAVCQFLPGPASSQLGFCLGLMRAGWLGALAAFSAFTLPSILLLIVFAMLAPQLAGDLGQAGIHGLKIVALAVVAHGVLGMAHKLCPDPTRATVAVGSLALVLLMPSALMQVGVVAAAALAGWMLCRDAPQEAVALRVPYGARAGGLMIAAALLGLVLLPLLTVVLGQGWWTLADAFYRSGALVFGGGHVVLPLLEEGVVQPGWVSDEAFLAGYGAAQAIPGPLFTFASYLGFVSEGPAGGLIGVIIASVAIFLPGFLLVLGMLPLWHRFGQYQGAARAVAGINAAVVGLLAAALYHPIWVSAVRDSSDLVIAVVAYLLIGPWQRSALWAVLWCVVASIAATAML